VRVFATGNGRKTDPVDAHSVAMAALYAPADPGLVRVRVDEDLLVMGMLVDRRDELGRGRTQVVNRLHRLLLELFPGGAKTFLSARQARALITTTKPRDLVGKTRRRLAVELIVELESIDKKIKAAEKNLTALVLERPPRWPNVARRSRRPGGSVWRPEWSYSKGGGGALGGGDRQNRRRDVTLCLSRLPRERTCLRPFHRRHRPRCPCLTLVRGGRRPSVRDDRQHPRSPTMGIRPQLQRGCPVRAVQT